MSAAREKIALGELVENRIVIWDIEESRRLFKRGFYGKPLGIPKPKAADFDAPLILDVMEAFYLMKKRLLRVRLSDSNFLSEKRMEAICQREYIDFKEKFFVYDELRESGLIVTPGIKFGCDFAIYEHGPGIDHAPYLVQVVKPAEKLSATGIVLSGRLATTVRKQFVIAVCDVQKSKVEFIAFDWWRA